MSILMQRFTFFLTLCFTNMRKHNMQMIFYTALVYYLCTVYTKHCIYLALIM